MAMKPLMEPNVFLHMKSNLRAFSCCYVDNRKREERERGRKGEKCEQILNTFVLSYLAADEMNIKVMFIEQAQIEPIITKR